MHNMYTLMNMCAPPVEGKSTDERNHAIKPHVTENCNAYMGLQINQTEWLTIMELPGELEVDKQIVFPPH